MIIYEEVGRCAPVEATDDPDIIKTALSVAGVRYDRWDATHKLCENADQPTILGLYADLVAELMQQGGFQSVDVFRQLPSRPHRASECNIFLAEHTHNDAEVRFFVEGGGTFYFRTAGKVVELRLQRGDLLNLPAGLRHWFDAGDPPYCTAIRLFTRPDGWVGIFTGDDIAGRFVRASA